MQVPMSCSWCHARGIHPVVDQVRSYVEANPLFFDEDDVALTTELFTLPAELRAIAAEDSATFQDAFEQAGVPRDTRDPVSELVLRIERAARDE